VSPLKKPMTDQEYVNEGGSKCPFCGDKRLDADTFQFDTAQAWRKITCTRCDRWWDETYILEGWSV
jgi:DNA-directed RNA polymerase subunit RPC12/RpoP